MFAARISNCVQFVSSRLSRAILCAILTIFALSGASQVSAAPGQSTVQPSTKLQSQIRAAIGLKHGARPDIGGSTPTINLAITSGISMVSIVPVGTTVTLTVTGNSSPG